MRYFLMITAAAVFSCSAALADAPVKTYLARPDTSVEQFTKDRDECAGQATRIVQKTRSVPNQAPYAPVTQNGMSPNQIWPARGMSNVTVYSYETSAPKFLACMEAKGYQQKTEPALAAHP